MNVDLWRRKNPLRKVFVEGVASLAASKGDSER
jgi:hypothetical protein